MAEKKNPYAHRAHRQKYKLGYGAEGAARGEHLDLHPDMKQSPKDESWESQPKEHGEKKAAEHVEGQMSASSPDGYKRK